MMRDVAPQSDGKGQRPDRLNSTKTERSGAARVQQLDTLRALLPDGAAKRDALLPLLHTVQEEFGYVDDALVPVLAELLNLSRADVHGVVTFYHDFRRTPPGRHVIGICRSESCRARGATAVERAIVARTGVAVGSTSADGRVTLDRVHCFGLCASGPVVAVDGTLHARLRPETAAALVGALA
jgi:formate dehydrogenase subunit gamma